MPDEPLETEELEEGASQEPEQAAEDAIESSETQEASGEQAKPKPTETVDYWKNEYFREKKKRQSLQSGIGKPPQSQQPQQQQQPRDLNSIQTIQELMEEIDRRNESKLQDKLSNSQKDSRLEMSQARARDKHSGEDGLPSYDDMIEKHVAPLVQQNPNVYQLIREMPDPAEAAYTLGIMMEFPNLAEKLRSEGRSDLVNKIDSTTKKAVTLRQGQKGSKSQSNGKLTADDIMNMSTDDFEKEIEKVKSGRAN